MLKRDRKLDLHRETLVRLDGKLTARELEAVVGGEISTSLPRVCTVTIP